MDGANPFLQKSLERPINVPVTFPKSISKILHFYCSLWHKNWLNDTVSLQRIKQLHLKENTRYNFYHYYIDTYISYTYIKQSNRLHITDILRVCGIKFYYPLATKTKVSKIQITIKNLDHIDTTGTCVVENLLWSDFKIILLFVKINYHYF